MQPRSFSYIPSQYVQNAYCALGTVLATHAQSQRDCALSLLLPSPPCQLPCLEHIAVFTMLQSHQKAQSGLALLYFNQEARDCVSWAKRPLHPCWKN